MRVLSARIENFGSYKELEFEFSNQSLTLLQGATGSGKSTLCDVIPWCLFGKTSKGGSVNEVLTWPGDSITKATVYLDTNVSIYRSRGPAAKDNDLMIRSADGNIVRGKDLNDTQSLINNLLGVDYELYLAGAYYHEFSQTASFFSAPAKVRRSICEQIVNLSLAVKLQTALSRDRSNLSKQVIAVMANIDTTEAGLQIIEETAALNARRSIEWQEGIEKTILNFKKKSIDFEADKAAAVSNLLKRQEIAAAAQAQANKTGTCLECGQPIVDRQEVTSDPYAEMLDRELSRVNDYEERIKLAESQKNPYSDNISHDAKRLADKTTLLRDLRAKQVELDIELSDLDTLQEITTAYRSITVANVISQLEANTNRLLTDYYDAEIKVKFTVEDADKLEVVLFKDGNECSFTQLSKGQRQLLKLCFGLSIMKAVSNYSGVNFDQIFLDEALSGLDEILKVKTYALLQHLATEYSSVFVVEHSTELKAMFSNSYNVSLVNGASQIEKA